jgi:hypothetical protein
MFVLCNLKLPEPNGPVDDDDLELSGVRDVGGCHLRRVRLADAGCDADSFTHLDEDDDNDDDDGVGGSDAAAAATTSRSEKWVKLAQRGVV